MGNDQAVGEGSSLPLQRNAIAIGVYQSINLHHQEPDRDVNTLARQPGLPDAAASLISVAQVAVQRIIASNWFTSKAEKLAHHEELRPCFAVDTQRRPHIVKK
jgi:hypothetical protein